MQHIGTTEDGTLHHWAVEDSAKVYLGDGAAKGNSLGALLAQFPDVQHLAGEDAAEPVQAGWEQGRGYREGDVVLYQGTWYEALPDVTGDYPPDNVYDLSRDSPTGGWKPLS